MFKKLGVLNTLLKSNADVNLQCNQDNTALNLVSSPYISQSTEIYEKLLIRIIINPECFYGFAKQLE